MFDMTLPDGVHAEIVTCSSDVNKMLREVYVQHDDDALDYWYSLPNVNNEQDMPQAFPCVLGLRWAGECAVDVVFVFYVWDITNLTYHLCKNGANLSDVQ